MMDHEFDFDTFVEDSSNRFAYTLCRDIVVEMGDRELLRGRKPSGERDNPLWIFGPTGCGKSHLLGAIRRRLEKVSYLSVCSVTGEEVSAALLAKLEGNHDEWERMKACDVLLMDDMDYVCGRRLMQEEVARMILDKCAKGQQVVLATCYAPIQFPGLIETLCRQAEDILLVDIAPPSQELCRALVSQYREQAPFPATDTALAYLIENARSFAHLRGALNAALFWHQTNGKKVTLWWAKKYLRATVR